MMQWEVRASWINGLRKQISQIVKSTNTCQFWLMYLPASSYTKIFFLPESSGLKSPYSASVGVYNIRPLWDSVSQHLRTSACALRKSISATHNIYRDMRSIRVNTPVFLFVSAKSEGEEVAVWRTMMMRCCSGNATLLTTKCMLGEAAAHSHVLQDKHAKEDYIAHVCSLDVEDRVFLLICYWLNMDTFAVHMLQSAWHLNPMLSVEWKSGGAGISIDHQSVPEVAKILHLHYNVSLINSVIKEWYIKNKQLLQLILHVIQ